MSLKIFQLFKILNPPYFLPPLLKGGLEGDFNLFYYSKIKQKVYRKT
jgi:hypothetical protein